MNRTVSKSSAFLFLLALLFSNMATAQKPTQASKGPQPVIIVTAEKSNIDDRVEALGTLRANETVVLTASVTESVTSVDFEDGQRVKAGDVLVEMVNAQEKAEFEGERAMADEAKKQYERILSLAKSGASSGSLLDQRRRDYETAKAGLDEVQSRISDRIITAPFSGVLGLRNISAGTVLQPGMKITTLDDDSVMKLDFSVPSVFLSAMKIGLEIEAKSNSFKDKVFKGTVSAIDSQIDPATRSITVRALIPNKDQLLKPGLLMSVDIFNNARQAIMLPEEAIIQVGSLDHVFVIETADGKEITKKRSVKLGSRRPGFVEILEGLQEGDRVVTHGTMNVADGTPVSILSSKDNQELLSDHVEEKSTTDKKGE